MAGFSNSIRKLSSKWDENMPPPKVKQLNQLGAGNIAKQRHSETKIEKPKKKHSKKRKKDH